LLKLLKLLNKRETMREIKFREWECIKVNKYKKELEEFRRDLYKKGLRIGANPYEYNTKTISLFEKEKGVNYESGWKKTYRMNYEPLVYDSENFGEFSMVRLNKALERGGDADCGGDSVFMQYTGLKDKNGKEIYEGDITTYGEVIFANGSFRYKHDGGFIRKEHEVIGNIYEGKQ
jgi:hypothetical protein